MTTKDFSIKWLAYALALLPVWFAQAFLVNRFPLFGVIPSLMPLAAVAVAVLEGASAGAGFGLAVGALFDTLEPGSAGWMTLALTLVGLCAGLLAQYVLRQDLLGCLVCSLLAPGRSGCRADSRRAVDGAGRAGGYGGGGRAGDRLVSVLCARCLFVVPLGVPAGSQGHGPVRGFFNYE